MDGSFDSEGLASGTTDIRGVKVCVGFSCKLSFNNS